MNIHKAVLPPPPNTTQEIYRLYHKYYSSLIISVQNTIKLARNIILEQLFLKQVINVGFVEQNY